ncbi:ArnT family glycosyltransferase [Frateuria defendens]|uniref:ArnT family glycosyltransferase n=1 Tax=Frateuria defendens TaxID=2219559 RepID=UPI00066FBF87|nr:glycosyltransferase family 39 protein [Frateuria defendens]
MPPTAYRRSEYLRSLWPWLPLWALAALLAIFAHGPMPLYSTRTLAVAWEMWSQHEWWVPHINGAPYSDKVPLLFWMIHAGWAVFGVNDVWPRVLEVVFGGAELMLLALLARRLFPNRPWVAKAAPWMLLGLSYASFFGLQIMYEVLLAVCVLAALNCLVPSDHRQEPRWLLFGLVIGAGLLTKGPVMLLHVAFPWLLGPLWSDWAAQHRGRWYGRGALALLLGLAVLLAWALPAGFLGGEDYRHRLFFSQTADRVASSQADHAAPFWWYLPMIPVLLFPFSGWPRAWAALATLRRPLDGGVRFALCWVLPVLVLFSLISGKQPYYPLPEFAGAALLLAGAIAALREQRPTLGNTAWLGTWPLGLGGLFFALALAVLPNLVASGRLEGHWLVSLSHYSRFFAPVFALLGGLLLMRGRGEMRRLAFAGLVGTFVVHSLFTLALWQNFDLRPTAHLLGDADRQGRAIGNLGVYEGQYHFEGRLAHPIQHLHLGAELDDFVRQHPDGLVVAYMGQPSAADLRYALLVQPFRGDWLAVWPAASLADLHAGRTPAEPPRPTRVYPRDPWAFRQPPQP